MHECPDCQQACDCDGEDTSVTGDCEHFLTAECGVSQNFESPKEFFGKHVKGISLDPRTLRRTKE